MARTKRQPIDLENELSHGKLKDYPVEDSFTTGRFKSVRKIKDKIKSGDRFTCVCAYDECKHESGWEDRDRHNQFVQKHRNPKNKNKECKCKNKDKKIIITSWFDVRQIPNPAFNEQNNENNNNNRRKQKTISPTRDEYIMEYRLVDMQDVTKVLPPKNQINIEDDE
eukprot:9546_1